MKKILTAVNKQKNVICAICIALCTMLAGCARTELTGGNQSAVKAGTIGEDTPIKRMQVAKMLALSVYDMDTVDSMERKIVFTDTDISKPYDKYINAAFTAGLISGADETHFEPEGYLSLEQAQFLLGKLDNTGTLQLKFDVEDRKKPISEAMWTEIFSRAMEVSNNTSVITCNIVPYVTGENCDELGDSFIMTDRGLYGTDCCNSDGYNDCTVSVLARDKEILAYKAVVNDEPSVIGAVVTQKDDNGARLDIGGVERYFLADSTKDIKVGDSISFKYRNNKITELETIKISSDAVSIQ